MPLSTEQQAIRRLRRVVDELAAICPNPTLQREAFAAVRETADWAQCSPCSRGKHGYCHDLSEPCPCEETT